MSKEVKRYNFDVDKFGSPRAYESEHGRWMKRDDYDALLAERDALRGLYKMHQQTETREMLDLRAERDALKGQVETLTGWYANSLDVVNEVTAILPGAHYMDPPDGGDVSIPEQVRRMAKDAERYRWLRMADWWDSPLCAVRNPAQQVKPGSDCPSRDRLDAAIDATLQGEQP